MATVAVETRPLRGSVATATIRDVGLGLFVVSVYLGVVVAGSALVGSGEQRTFLMLVATALVAVALGPTTRWLAKLANRIVYAHRLSPWEAVSRLSNEMGAEQDPDEILVRLADVVRAGTGGARAVVWLRVQRALVPVAASPEGPLESPVTMDDGELPDLTGLGSVVAIRQAGETLGAITVDGTVCFPSSASWWTTSPLPPPWSPGRFSCASPSAGVSTSRDAATRRSPRPGPRPLGHSSRSVGTWSETSTTPASNGRWSWPASSGSSGPQPRRTRRVRHSRPSNWESKDLASAGGRGPGCRSR